MTDITSEEAVLNALIATRRELQTALDAVKSMESAQQLQQECLDDLILCIKDHLSDFDGVAHYSTYAVLIKWGIRV